MPTIIASLGGRPMHADSLAQGACSCLCIAHEVTLALQIFLSLMIMFLNYPEQYSPDCFLYPVGIPCLCLWQLCVFGDLPCLCPKQQVQEDWGSWESSLLSHAMPALNSERFDVHFSDSCACMFLLLLPGSLHFGVQSPHPSRQCQCLS